MYCSPPLRTVVPDTSWPASTYWTWPLLTVVIKVSRLHLDAYQRSCGWIAALDSNPVGGLSAIDADGNALGPPEGGERVFGKNHENWLNSPETRHDRRRRAFRGWT